MKADKTNHFPNAEQSKKEYGAQILQIRANRKPTDHEQILSALSNIQDRIEDIHAYITITKHEIVAGIADMEAKNTAKDNINGISHK